MFTDIIVSFDVESNGNVPGIHSLWSIGAAAFVIEKDGDDNYTFRKISEFEVNLTEIPEFVSDHKTMEFWETFPGAWEHARKDQVEPAKALHKFELWLEKLGGQYLLAAWPATFDLPFLTYYFHRFLGSCPFSTKCLEMRSYAFALFQKTNWRDSGLGNLPPGWLPENPKKHFALNDAVAQGELACKLIIENLK